MHQSIDRILESDNFHVISTYFCRQPTIIDVRKCGILICSFIYFIEPTTLNQYKKYAHNKINNCCLVSTQKVLFL